MKVLDFGIAEIMRSQASTGSFSSGRDLIFGTPGYMSPEQALGLADLDCRCDLWGLATVAFETLTHELPVPGMSAKELVAAVRKARTARLTQYRSDLPRSVDAFFERAFAKRPNARFANAAELTLAFDQALLANSPPKEAVTSTTSPALLAAVTPSTSLSPADRATYRPRRRRPFVIAMALAVMATGFAGLNSHRLLGRGFTISFSPAHRASPESHPPNAQAAHASALTPHLEKLVDIAPARDDTMPTKIDIAPAKTGETPAASALIMKTAIEVRPRAAWPATGIPNLAVVNSRARGDTPGVREPDGLTSREVPSEVSGQTLECAPPYVVDASAKKHWKLECL